MFNKDVALDSLYAQKLHLNLTAVCVEYHSSKESYRLCKKDYETEEEARVQQTAVEPLLNELMNV
jgi:hypothetical protein